MSAIIPPKTARANDAAKAQKRLGQNARPGQALRIQARLYASDRGFVRPTNAFCQRPANHLGLAAYGFQKNV